VLATVATVMSRGWLSVPAGVVLVVAFAAVLAPRSYRRIGALIGAVSIQVILRWPPLGFHGATVLLAALAVAPVLISAWRTLRSRQRTLTLAGAGALVGFGGRPFCACCGQCPYGQGLGPGRDRRRPPSPQQHRQR
jgi:hypothetical protein